MLLLGSKKKKKEMFVLVLLHLYGTYNVKVVCISYGCLATNDNKSTKKYKDQAHVMPN